MGKRILCLICAAVLVIAVFGLPAGARGWETPTHAERLSARGIARSTTPLVSAMFLILAGLGISMLFDKRDKR